MLRLKRKTMKGFRILQFTKGKLVLWSQFESQQNKQMYYLSAAWLQDLEMLLMLEVTDFKTQRNSGWTSKYNFDFCFLPNSNNKLHDHNR